MNRSKRLDRVSELRKDEERKAGCKLAEAQQQQEGQQQMLDQLLQYRREYQRLFEEQSAHGLDAQQYRNFQQFFQQLDRAVLHQRRSVAVEETRVEQSRHHWMQKRQATETLARLSSMAREDEQREHQKQEQKQADETFSRRQRS